MNVRRLLILDDDLSIGSTIQFIAESVGVQVRFCSDHKSFFDLVENWLPTHIALDLVMPEMDGVEVLVHLGKMQFRARIIITSGLGPRVLDAAMRSGKEHGLEIIGVLPKPFSPSTLRELLSEKPLIKAPHTIARQNGGNTRAQDNVLTTHIFLDALHNREFRVVYQPKVDCKTGRVCGFEALMRWHKPSGEVVMPDQFIPFAEANGLIDAMTEQLLEQALTWYAGLLMQISSNSAINIGGKIHLSMNLSAVTLKDTTFVERVVTHCEEHSINPSQIVFELTETSAMEDPVASLDLLTRLRLKGFQLSIDDFGTGFSSMMQLVRLPFSEIKVDKSFVMTAHNSHESKAIIRSIVDLGRSLGLRSIAEGVEDKKTLEYLRDIGCDQVQGYFISRPIAADLVADWIISRDDSLTHSF